MAGNSAAVASDAPAGAERNEKGTRSMRQPKPCKRTGGRALGQARLTMALPGCRLVLALGHRVPERLDRRAPDGISQDERTAQ